MPHPSLVATLASTFSQLEFVNENRDKSLWSGWESESKFAVHCVPKWAVGERLQSESKARFKNIKKLHLSAIPTPEKQLESKDHLIFIEEWIDLIPWEQAVLSRETALGLGMELFDLLAELHQHDLAHGNIQTSCLAVESVSGRLKLLGMLSRVPEEDRAFDTEIDQALESFRSFLTPAEFAETSLLRSGREISRKMSRYLGHTAPERTEPDFVGRDRFLSKLDQALSKGGMLSVEAPAGTGKSRLIQEWTKGETFRVLRGKAVKESAPRPFQLFLEPFEQLEAEFEINIGLFTELRESINISVPLLNSFSHENRLQRSSMVWLAKLLEHLSENKKTVLILEDVHWADEFTLGFLQFWNKSPGKTLVLVTLRPDELKQGHQLRGADIPRLELPNLTKEQSVRVLRSVQPSAGETLIESALNRSRGNPFLLLQFLRSGTLEGNFHQVAVSSLSKTTQKALATAAVVGNQFDLPLLEHCLGEKVPLESGLESGIITRSFQAYQFSHDSFREACLSLLSAPEIAQIHIKIAEALSQADVPNPFRIAFHFQAGGQPDRGFHYSLEAARTARKSHDLSTAAYYFQTSLSGLTDQDCQRAELHYQLGDCFRLIGRYLESQTQLEIALECTESFMVKARILHGLGDVHFKQAQLEKAKEATIRGLNLLGERQPRSLLLSLLAQTFLLTFRTVFPQRGKEQERELDLLKADLYNRLAYVCWFLDGPIASIRAHLRELNTAERFGQSSQLARAQANHAMAMSALPWWNRALLYGSRALETAKEIDDKWTEGQVGHFYGAALLGSGQLKEARRELLSARKLLRETGDRWEENGVCYHLALIYYRLGALDKAAELAQQTQRTGIEINDRLAAGDNLFTWARARQGEIPRKAIDDENRFSSPDLHRACELLCAEALVELRAENFQRAVFLFRAAREKYQAKRVQNLYSSSIPCWITTAERLWAQASSGEDRKKRLRSAKSSLKIALRQSAKYRTNRAHALREQGLLALAEGDYGPARAALIASRAEALEAGQGFEVRISTTLLHNFECLLGDTHFPKHEDAASCLWLVGQSADGGYRQPAELSRLLQAASNISQCLSTPTALHQLCEGSKLVLGAKNAICAVIWTTEQHSTQQLSGDFGIELPKPPFTSSLWSVHSIMNLERPAYLVLRNGTTPVSEKKRSLITFLVKVTETVLDRATSAASSTLLSQNLQRSTDQLGQEASRLLQAREQLLLSERLALTGRLAAGLVHDLRNLTLTINGTAELLTLDMNPSDGLTQELRDILDAGRKSDQLLTQLSKVTRGDVMGIQSVDLNQRIEENLPLLKSICGPLIELEFDFCESALARIDPLTLDRILLNLVMNARDAAPPGGTVNISTTIVEVRKTHDSFPCEVPPGTYSVVTIADNGCGISEEILPHIFELYFTTKGASGTGVGLATVLEMTEGCDGYLTVESGRGGTVFEVHFRSGMT